MTAFVVRDKLGNYYGPRYSGDFVNNLVLAKFYYDENKAARRAAKLNAWMSSMDMDVNNVFTVVTVSILEL